MKVGIFGGTFNPPHKTHCQIAQLAQKQLGLDKLIVVPCGLPPHKKCYVDSATRLELTKIAFPQFEVSDYEISKQGKSYTVETLHHFRSLFEGSQLFLIMGGDSYRNFDKWYCPQEIASLATLAVADRQKKTSPQTVLHIEQATGAQAVFLEVVPNRVSSEEIRLRYEFGFDNADFVPKAVDEYVLQHGLYSRYRNIALKLRNYLPEKRLLHTFYVVKRGLEFATEEDYDRVFLACLLHDCTKYVAPTDYAKYGFAPSEDIPQPVIHSFLGEYVARADFGVTDQEVLDAIAYHTTGCPNMTRLQKIVYVADKTEETRPYPLEHLLKGSLDENFLACVAEANCYTTQRHGKNLCPLTEQTLKFYFGDNKK